MTLQFTKNDEKIATSFPGYTPEQVSVIKATVAKGTTDTELALFIYTATSAGLNPLLKEIWCFKDNRGNLLIFAGRDGFLKKAQQHPKFAGMRSGAVREKDTFKINIPAGQVDHVIDKPHDQRGRIIGAYAFVYRRDEEPTLVWVDFDTYDRGRGATYQTPWKSHPEDMICKVAEIRALKRAFGMAELQSEFEWNVTRDGRAQALDNELLPDFKSNQR